MTNDAYKTALVQAETDLAKAIEQRDKWTVEIARLEQLKNSLSATIKPDVRGSIARHAEEVGFQDVVLALVGESAKPIIAMDIRDRMKEIGYDLTKFKNPMALIHGALKRLAANDVIEDVGQGQFKRKKKKSPFFGDL